MFTLTIQNWADCSVVCWLSIINESVIGWWLLQLLTCYIRSSYLPIIIHTVFLFLLNLTHLPWRGPFNLEYVFECKNYTSTRVALKTSKQKADFLWRLPQHSIGCDCLLQITLQHHLLLQWVSSSTVPLLMSLSCAPSLITWHPSLFFLSSSLFFLHSISPRFHKGGCIL